MNFSEISNSHSCECLKNSLENVCDVFVRKVRRSSNLSESDFRTHKERGKLSPEENDCDNICGMNALSFEIWNEYSWEVLLEKYNTTAKFSPQSGKKNLCVVRFLRGSGLVKHTPFQINEKNDFHYDFYKSDSFNVNALNLIEMIQLISA